MMNSLRVHIDSGRFPHALVIDGGTDEQRMREALEFCAALLCESEGKKPCGNCPQCKKALENQHPDIINVVREKDRKNIGIKILRDMVDDAYVLPNDSDKKIYIIPHADEIEQKNQNALLKTLEEPPAHATFILLCPSHSVLIGTILSRVSIFSLEEVSEVKKQDAEKGNELATNIADAIAKRDEAELVFVASAFDKNTDILEITLEALKLIVRDALFAKAGNNTFIGPSTKSAKSLAGSFSNEQLTKLQKAIADLEYAISVHSNKNLTQTRLSSHLFEAIL